MYNSPINTIVTQMQMQYKAQLENDIFKAVQNVVVNVDKEELLKALQYGRGQYDKGYKDGIREFAERLKNLIYPQLGISTYEKGEAFHFCLDEIDNLVKEMTEGGNG